MTRINCVPVEELSQKHLVAEYREIGRVYALAVSAYQRGEQPASHGDRYTLGAGHVRFFYSRLGYVAKRHRQLIREMLRRGYNPTYRTVLLPDLPRPWCRNWTPTPEAQAINRERIKQRGGVRMQHKKQAAVKRICRDCGSQILGKYAAKNHICRPMVESREAGLAKQRRTNHG